jgi:hypothetical protein
MTVTDVAYPSRLEWLLPTMLVLFGVLLAVALVIVAVGIILDKENGMDRPERIAQLYGYSVCLIAIVVFVISVASIIDNAFKYADPIDAAGFAYGVSGGSLSSFEAYKATYGTLPSSMKAETQKPSDSELRQRYEALVRDRVAPARFDAAKSLTTSAVLLGISLLLFMWHWRWLRGRSRAQVTADS